MEWVETTGRTVEEAKNAALEMLGVDVDDAEFEIVEELARFKERHDHLDHLIF